MAASHPEAKNCAGIGNQMRACQDLAHGMSVVHDVILRSDRADCQRRQAAGEDVEELISADHPAILTWRDNILDERQIWCLPDFAAEIAQANQ